MTAKRIQACGTFLVAAFLAVASGRLSGQSTEPPAVPVQGAEPAAADSALEAMTSVLAAELRCPVCQGNSIQDSPSELAQEMRGLIRDQLRAGRTPDEVRAYFEDKYGEWILLRPRAEGFNLIVYVVPLVALALGGWIVWRSIRRWTSPTVVTPSMHDE